MKTAPARFRCDRCGRFISPAGLCEPCAPTAVPGGARGHPGSVSAFVNGAPVLGLDEVIARAHREFLIAPHREAVRPSARPRRDATAVRAIAPDGWRAILVDSRAAIDAYLAIVLWPSLVRAAHGEVPSVFIVAAAAALGAIIALWFSPIWPS